MSKVIRLTEKDISNLVKKVLNEQQTTNYMFFSNLEQIKRQCELLLELDPNVVDLDTNEEHLSLLWFNVALKNALKPLIGQKVLGRIGQGIAKPGKNPPWLLNDATGDADAVAKANAYIANGLAAPAAPATATAPAPANINDPAVQALLAQLGAKPIN